MSTNPDALRREALVEVHDSEGDYLTRDWNENVLHVYPRTFNELRHEGEEHLGMGSILGITDKLDWMKDSGITAIWLGPIYESPGLDGNYDISDYRKVNPELGTLEDVEAMIAAAHERGIRVIFDLVPNHTSDQSEWFIASSDPKHNDHERYKDFYIWRDPIVGELPKNIVGEDRLAGLADGLTVPNNWSSIFSLPQIDEVKKQHHGKIPEGVDIPAVTAWVWSEKRGQFYLAEFMKEQPSLSMDNPQVREEIKSVIRYWLDLGVDSFRVDVMNHIGKDTEFLDEEPATIGEFIGEYKPGTSNPHDQWKQERLVSYWPHLGEYADDLLTVLDEEKYQGRNVRMVFEDWMSALGGDSRLDELRPEKANVFNFEMLLNTDRAHWTAQNIGRVISGYYGRMDDLNGAVANQVTGNHDTDTLRTRLGSPRSMRAAYLMLAALPGALYTWQGDMMGRPNAIVPEDLQQDGDIGKRDGERIPMQWDDSINGGFSKATFEKLWLPSVDPKIYKNDNIALQSRDPNSPYMFIKQVLNERKDDIALREGPVRMLKADHSDIVAFARSDPNNPRRQVISVTNMSGNSIEVSLLDVQQARARIIISSLRSELKGEEIDLTMPFILEPDEAYLLESAV